MKFKTKRNSGTGKKFTALLKKIEEGQIIASNLSKELGYCKWRTSNWNPFGGVSSVVFKDKEKVDKSIWKNVNASDNEWLPRLNTKLGKVINEKLKSVPVISNDELNKCANFKGDPFQRIGVSFINKEYIGFIIKENWEYKAPKDCEEITVTEWNKLFKD